MTRYVLYSERDGVFIGEGLGIPFWSKIDAAGQDCAVTFPSAEEATKHAALFCAHTDVRVVPVEADINTRDMAGKSSGYASINACVAAGLPAWDASV